MAKGKQARAYVAPTVCLYRNARLNVKYVYGYPVAFDPDPRVIAMREADKAACIAAQRGA